MEKLILYGVFGDTPRTDKKNIDSIWMNKQNAEDRKRWLTINDEWSNYHIETLTVDDLAREQIKEINEHER